MTFTFREACVPVFAASLRDMPLWLDKATAGGADEAALMQARLAPDMHPLPKQVQIACDLANRACARLAGVEPPSFPDTEASFAELKARLARTLQTIEAIDPAAFDGAEDREVSVMRPDGSGYRFSGRDYLLRFALPNFFFHVTTAYAVLRHSGVQLGKPDFMAHVGPPNIMPAAA